MGIVAKGFDQPSPIQEEAIPMILASNAFLPQETYSV